MPTFRRSHLATSVLVGSALVNVAGEPAAAQDSVIVKQLSMPTMVRKDSTPDEFTLAAGRLYFAATEAAYGRELWSSNGEPGSPLSVVDIYPGSGSSSPRKLTVGADEALYFLATPPVGGSTLLRSDGTAAGTVALHSGFLEGTQQGLRVTLVPIGAGLVAHFERGGADASALSEVWATDGTPAGTVQLPGGGVTGFAEQGFVRAGNLGYYLTKVASPASIELWVTDGTVAGSHAVSTLGSGSSLTRFGFVGSLGTQAFYTIAEGTGTALWASDGTAAGTRRLLLLPGYNALGASQSTTFLGKLFFTVWSAAGTREIWQSDGTTDGTTAVLTNANSGIPSTIYSFAVSGSAHDRLFFAAYATSSQVRVWVTDGSPAGTLAVQDIGSSGLGLPPILPTDIIGDLDGRAVFSSSQTVWASDGTIAGTVPLAQQQAASIASVRPINGRAYFAGNNTSIVGVEVYRNPMTTLVPELVHDIAPAGWTGGAPTLLDSAGDLLFFAAQPQGTSRGYYRSDGTEVGTFRLATIDVVSSPSMPTPVDAGLATVFRGSTAATGRKVFRTDGTAAGTGVLVDLVPGTGNSVSSPLVNFEGNCLFGTTAGLYRTDGTPQGTEYLGIGTQVSELISVPGRAYCKAVSGMWSTDGTAAGTQIIGNFPTSAFPLAATENYLLAQTANATSFTLHRITETANPLQLTNTTFMSISSTGAAHTNIGDVIVFIAWPTGGNISLWRTDGTPPGTYALTTETLPSDTRILAQIGNLVLFPRNTDGLGAELWATDGTVEGTYLVKDIYPGPVPSRPRGLTAINGRVYFFAESPGAGAEPWVSDGTPGGTHALGEVCPGPVGAVPGAPVSDQRPAFAGLGHHVYFLADDGENGTQLRAVFVCPANFNSDGTLDPDDLSDFIGAFFADPAGPGSDFNADGTADPDDLSDYITAFFAGCA